MKLSVVIPAYNEINTILEIVRRVRAVAMSRLQIILFDRFIPFFIKIEKFIKIPFGLSLFVVCKKEHKKC